MIPILSLVLLAAAVQGSVITFSSPRLSIKSSNSTLLRSEELSTTSKFGTPFVLSPTDVLKITFQIVEKESGQGVQPHQTFLRFYDAESGEEGIQPVRVTSGGKAKFEMNMAHPPTSLPPTADAPLQVSLLLGSFVHDPIKFDLFDLSVPASQPPPQHPDEPSFHLLPEISHTFRPDQKSPPKAVSAVFTLLVLSPWLVLINLWSRTRPRVPYLFSPKILSFTVVLGAFEGLLFWYWIGLSLGQVLLYGGMLGIVAVFAGNYALSTIGERRLSKK